MALAGKNGCIAKVQKEFGNLDPDDRAYVNDLIKRGRPDAEIISRLQQRLEREQANVVEMFENQGIKVQRASTETNEETAGAGSSGPPAGGDSDVSSLGFGTVSVEGDPEPGKSKPRDSGALILSRETADQALQKLSDASDLIKRYLKGNRKKLFLDAATNSYFADLDVINVQGPRSGNTLDLNTEAGLKRQVEVLEHEIIHANTVAYMKKHLSERSDDAVMRDIKYLGKAVVELGSLDTSRLSAETARRINYLLSQNDLEVAVAEFIAIMGAESDVSQEIYKAFGRRQGLDRKTLSETLRRFVKRIARLLTDQDMAGPVDIDLLNGALLRTMQQGESFREQSYQEFKKYSDMLGAYRYERNGDGIQYQRKASMDYLNYAVASMINSPLERKGQKMIGQLHQILWERFPMYQDVASKLRGVYDGSPHLQQFIHTVTGEGVDKMKKADVLAKFAAINAQRTEIINDQISQLHTLSKDLTDKERSLLDVVTSQMPLHDYFDLADHLTTAEHIEAEAELLRKELWKQNTPAVRDVDRLVDWNIEEKPGTTIYNLDTKYPMYGENKFGIKLRKLLALESIKRIGAKDFEKLLQKQELMDVIRDNSVANKLATLTNEGLAPVRDSLVMDYYAEPHQKRAITLADIKQYEFENTGWKILKRPTRTELGIVYRPTIDSTDVAGAYTDTKLVSTDIDVPETMRKYPGVVETKTGYKLLIPKELKREMGLIEDFSQGLVRSTAHSVAIQESQIIRDALLQEDTWMTVGGVRNTQELQDIIKSDNVDNPWFLKLQEGKTFDELPSDIKAKYMPVGKRASNVKGFNESVDLVRKDISHWLLGGSAKSLFENPQMKWGMRILKNLVSGAKIGMVVLNPIKIANDNMSNLTYLGVLGLDPIFIAKNYQDIQKSFAEYSDLQRQIFQLKLKLVGRPESTKTKQQLKKLQKRLAANSIGDIADKGFVNSLGSDLVSRSADTLSGFQADMHKALEYLLLDEKGNRRYVSHFIIEMQKIGFQAEDFFQYLGGIANRSKSTKLMGQELDQVAERLRTIKSEEDIINYVAQITTSPSSELVRVGSAMTDLTDVLAKETLYRHLVQNKQMSPEKARIQVLDSFPDYKENMPLAVQQLSDVGIIMFPSFWLRIQKIIYRMLRDRPINLATEIAAQEMLGTDITTIFDANVINKSQTFGGLFHMPFEPVGVGSVIPTHAW